MLKCRVKAAPSMATWLSRTVNLSHNRPNTTNKQRQCLRPRPDTTKGNSSQPHNFSKNTEEVNPNLEARILHKTFMSTNLRLTLQETGLGRSTNNAHQGQDMVVLLGVLSEIITAVTQGKEGWEWVHTREHTCKVEQALGDLTGDNNQHRPVHGVVSSNNNNSSINSINFNNNSNNNDKALQAHGDHSNNKTKRTPQTLDTHRSTNNILHNHIVTDSSNKDRGEVATTLLHKQRTRPQRNGMPLSQRHNKRKCTRSKKGEDIKQLHQWCRLGRCR